MSHREAEVLEAVGRHLTNAQIASRMHISVRTVESHVSSLLRKFGVADRRALADLAPRALREPAPEAEEQPPASRGHAGVLGLPAARTSFIGRERECQTVRAALADSRVVTLVGPGGVGKTRLAAKTAEAVAADYTFGGAFVDLVPVREGFVAQAVAALLGVTERPGRSLDAALHEFLARGRTLLVLDNCEHLLGVVAAFVEKLMADCAGLTVLATSRERLAIPGERTVAVPPLSLVGGDRGGTVRSDAAALFEDRARTSDPEFAAAPEAVGEVCTRLDGVPLAIELAAARSASLGVDGLLAGLKDYLRLLAGSRGPHERHRSLRAVIDWSHDLLDSDERTLFRRVSVFAGGFDLDAAEAVASVRDRGTLADLVGRLTDKSLLIHHRGPGGSRWQMLGTIQAYAQDRLAASGEAAAVREAHLTWAACVADDLEHQLEKAHGETEQQWRDAFDTVADDLREALRQALRPGTDRVSHQLARTLGHLAYARRFMVEAREHYQDAAERAAGPAEAAADLRSAADAALARGDGGIAFELLGASAEWASAAGDDRARTVALAYAATIADRFWADFPRPVSHDRERELFDQAVAACPAGDPVSAAYLAAAAAWTARPEKPIPDPALADDALTAARRTADPVLISGALDAAVNVLDTSGHLREAHQRNQERTRLLERLPRHDPRAGVEIVDIFHMATEIAVTAGDLPDALATAQMATHDDIAGGQPHISASKPIFPLVLQGKFDQALTQAAIMWETWERAGRPAPGRLAAIVYAVILAHGLRGDDEGRREWQGRLGELIGPAPQVSSTHLATVAAFTEARIALHEGRLDAAVTATAGLPLETQPWYEDQRWRSRRAYAWALAAEVAVVAGSPGTESRLAAAAPAGEENYWAAACLARAAGRLRTDRGELERSVQAWERIGARFERACTLLLLEDRAQEGHAELDALGCPPPREAAGR